jgi:hypothetical protein
MKTLTAIMRLRWLIVLGLLAIAWMTFKPVAYVLTTVVCCAAPLDLLITLLPGGRRKADQARRAQVKAESRRMLDQP